MSYELCEKVSELEPYEPITGNYRIRLDANESFYSMPENIKREIKVDDRIEFIRSKVVDSAINKYRIFLSFKSCNEVRNKIKDYTKKIELASAEIAKLSKENMLVKLLLLPGYPLYRILSFVYRRHLKKKGML